VYQAGGGDYGHDDDDDNNNNNYNLFQFLQFLKLCSG
jgi:hypothetical protein